MAKKAAKPTIQEDQDHQPLDESTEHEPAEHEPADGQISKAEAARRTLAEGIELPRKASVYIKQKYGLDISPQQFSAEKSRMKLRLGGFPSGDGLRYGSRLSAYSAPSYIQSDGDPGLLEALEAIKPLIESLGADKVKRMVDLLG